MYENYGLKSLSIYGRHLDNNAAVVTSIPPLLLCLVIRRGQDFYTVAIGAYPIYPVHAIPSLSVFPRAVYTLVLPPYPTHPIPQSHQCVSTPSLFPFT